MTAAWTHLPNAAHIDRILADATRRPDVWAAARTAAGTAAWGWVWIAAETTSRDASRLAARDAAWGAALHAVWTAAEPAARDAAWTEARNAAWTAVRTALAALIAWDDCALLLDSEPDALRLLATDERHPAVLLLPACIALKTI